MSSIIDRQQVNKLLDEQVRSEVKQIVSEEAEKAAREAERRVNEMVDRIALNIISRYSVERMGNDVLIRVQKLLETPE